MAELALPQYPDSLIKSILRTVKTIAMVGASGNDIRPSYFAMMYLLNKGYKVIPVNPSMVGKEAFYRQLEMPLSEAYAYASRVMTENMLEGEACEGISAFLEKREPKWPS